MKAHGPVGEVAPIGSGLMQDGDLSVAWVGGDLCDQGPHGGFLALQHLEKFAALVQQHPSDSKLLVVWPGLREQLRQLPG